jgi:hypothetical protein
MESTELRIGNLVYFTNEVVEVIIIDGYHVSLKNAGNLIIDEPLTGEVHPIPLTEDKLVEFGFEVRKTIMSAAYEKNGFIIYLSEYKNPNKFELGLDEDVVIEYVHTLQNLYYALKQEEL